MINNARQVPLVVVLLALVPLSLLLILPAGPALGGEAQDHDVFVDKQGELRRSLAVRFWWRRKKAWRSRHEAWEKALAPSEKVNTAPAMLCPSLPLRSWN